VTTSGPLRVAHIIHSLGPGGAENVLVDLATVAASAQLELVVVALSPVPDPVHARTLRTRGVAVVELELGRWDLRAVPRTMRILRDHRVELVHTHLKHADVVGAIAARWLGLPVLSTLHVIEDAGLNRTGRYKRAAGVAARRSSAARTIALSSSQRSWYAGVAGSTDHLVVLPNGVADPGPPGTADIAGLRSEIGVPRGAPLIVSVSLMRPEKGHALLLDAVATLPQDWPGIVALAGDGPLRPGLEGRVRADPALRDRVRFLGYRSDVPTLLRAADLVLHTSLEDALPTTLIQALAVGVPIVATDVGGIPDIVTPDVGRLVPARSDAIAGAVLALLENPGLPATLGAAGRLRYEERFEAEGWARRLRGIYDEVLAERPAARRASRRSGATTTAKAVGDASRSRPR
jgi:glycosyltransferase involved in cell wall biosynthesis